MDKKYAKKLFLTAWEHCEEHHPGMLEWAEGVNEDTVENTFKNMRAKRFLSNYCQVVYTGGFRLKIFEKIFPELETAFKGFDIAALSKMRSIKPVLDVFNNERKANYFLEGAKMIADQEFGIYKQQLRERGIDTLGKLPGIGPKKKFHLAKNIGLADKAKPDTGLERAAHKCKAASVEKLVDYLSAEFDLSRHIVDVILRYGVEKRLAMNDNTDGLSMSV